MPIARPTRRRLARLLYPGLLLGMLATNVYAFVHLQAEARGDRTAFPRERNRLYALEPRQGRRLSDTLDVRLAGMMDARAMQSLAVDYAIQESLFGHELYAPRSAALHPRLWRRRGLVPLHLVDDRQPLPPTESWKRRSASRYRLLVGDVTIHLPFLPGEGPGGELHLYADDQDPNTFYVLTPEESARWSGPDR